MTTETGPVTELHWEPPGKGDWRGLHDHFPRALTAEYRTLLADGMTEGEALWLERYGFPVRTIEPVFIHGRVFIAAAPLVGPRSNAMPHAWAMRVALKLVPAFRRRARSSQRAVAERPWLAEAERWFDHEQDEWVARDTELEAVDPSGLDEAALVRHLRDVRALAGEGYRAHFRLHGCDLIPTGMLLVRAIEWGLDPVAVAGLLAGSSPVSRGDVPLPAWCLVTGYDIDEKTAGELPHLGSAPSRPVAAIDPVDESGLREQVPASERAEWDRLLADARATCGVRDSNGLLTAAWPVGLLRRAMLEAGRRLADRGRLDDPGHAVELTIEELAAALESPTGGSTAALAADRHAERRRLSEFAAPASLGPPQDLPLAALPAGMRTVTAALLCIRDLGITAIGERDPLRGVGIGSGSVVGRACVASEPAEAFARFEPGDIVVTRGTCPAWNSVLALAGGVVTEEGGPLSHAAVIARELGLPALIGCAEAMDRIPDGATIEVDVSAGAVRLVN